MHYINNICGFLNNNKFNVLFVKSIETQNLQINSKICVRIFVNLVTGQLSISSYLALLLNLRQNSLLSLMSWSQTTRSSYHRHHRETTQQLEVPSLPISGFDQDFLFFSLLESLIMQLHPIKVSREKVAPR